MTSSICRVMDQFGEALDTNEFSQYSEYAIESGDVMDELFESVSMLSPNEPRRCRTLSTCSMSSTFTSYNSCEIFPEIADLMVIASGGSDYDIRDQLASGKDYIRVEDVVESPQTSRMQQADVHGHYDANTMEMLVTLGFKSRDLTSSSDLWPEINLCWSGDSKLTDVKPKFTTAVDICNMKSDELQQNNESDVSCIDGIAALDVTSLLEQFEEAESRANQAESVATMSVEQSSHLLDTNSSSSDICISSESSDCAEGHMSVKRRNADIEVCDNDWLSANEIKHVDLANQFQTKECDALPKRKRGRPPKAKVTKKTVDTKFCSEIGVNPESTVKVDDRKLCNTIKDVGEMDTETVDELSQDLLGKAEGRMLSPKLLGGKGELELQISEQKKQEMMEKARAISLKISRKVEEEKQEKIPPKVDDAVKASPAPSLSQNDRHSRNKSFKIPRLVKTKSENEILPNNHEDTMSRVTPPLLKLTSINKDASSKGWQKIPAKNDNLMAARKEMKVNRPTSSVKGSLGIWIPCAPERSAGNEIDTVVPMESTVGKQQSPIMQAVESSQTCMTNSPSEPCISVAVTNSCANAVVLSSCGSAVMSQVSVNDAKLKSTVLVPSQEVIDKIAASAKRKAAILLPNAVPALRERGPAVGIVVSSSLKTCVSTHVEDIKGQKVLSESKINDATDSLSVTETKPAKRKLNLSQYKSILPQRRKVLAPTSAVDPVVKSTLSVVHFYGNSQLVVLDHDYCKKESTDKLVTTVVEEESIKSAGEQCSNRVSNCEASGVSPIAVCHTETICKIKDPSTGQTRICHVEISDRISPESSRDLNASPKLMAFSVPCDKDVSDNIASSTVGYKFSNPEPELVSSDSACCEISTLPCIMSASQNEVCSQETNTDDVMVHPEVLDELYESETASQWKKVRQRAKRNYRRNSDQNCDLGVQRNGDSSISSDDVSVFQDSAANNLDAENIKTGVCRNVRSLHVSSADFSALTARSTLHVKREVLDERQIGSLTELCSVSLRSRSVRSPSHDASVGRSSRSSDCSQRKYGRRGRSYSDSSSSRSRSPGRYRSPVHHRRRSRSRSRFRSRRSRSRSREYYRRSRSRSLSRSRSRRWKGERRVRTEYDRQQQDGRFITVENDNEQRCVVYVGRIPKDHTTSDLCRQLKCFGEIVKCSVHIRKNGVNEDGTIEISRGKQNGDEECDQDSPVIEGEPKLDHYGFVTFRSPAGAYAAIERGRTVPGCEGFDFSFGARRQFCKTGYSDLDGNKEIEEEYPRMGAYSRACDSFSFDALLKQATQKIKKKR